MRQVITIAGGVMLGCIGLLALMLIIGGGCAWLTHGDNAYNTGASIGSWLAYVILVSAAGLVMAAIVLPIVWISRRLRRQP